jgi:transcription-repair coupling factor (superfamily II helicase)
MGRRPGAPYRICGVYWKQATGTNKPRWLLEYVENGQKRRKTRTSYAAMEACVEAVAKALEEQSGKAISRPRVPHAKNDKQPNEGTTAKPGPKSKKQDDPRPPPASDEARKTLAELRLAMAEARENKDFNALAKLASMVREYERDLASWEREQTRVEEVQEFLSEEDLPKDPKERIEKMSPEQLCALIVALSEESFETTGVGLQLRLAEITESVRESTETEDSS